MILKIGQKLRPYTPTTIAVGIFIALLMYRNSVSFYLLNPDSRVEMGNLFAAVFDWSSIQTGFLFAVYGYVASKGEGFIAAIKRTPVMRSFKRLLGITIFAGFILTLISMCFLIYPLVPGPSWQYAALSAWFALFCWSFMLFCSVAYRFGKIVNVPDHDRNQKAG